MGQIKWLLKEKNLNAARKLTLWKYFIDAPIESFIVNIVLNYLAQGCTQDLQTETLLPEAAHNQQWSEMPGQQPFVEMKARIFKGNKTLHENFVFHKKSYLARSN